MTHGACACETTQVLALLRFLQTQKDPQLG
jgi:hypothetical protein